LRRMNFGESPLNDNLKSREGQIKAKEKKIKILGLYVHL